MSREFTPKVVLDAEQVIIDAYERNEWYTKRDIDYAKKELDKVRILPNVGIFKDKKPPVESNETWLVENTHVINELKRRHRREVIKNIGAKALIFALVLFTPISSAAEVKPSCFTNDKNTLTSIDPVSKKDNSAQIIYPIPSNELPKFTTDKFTPKQSD